MKDIKLQLERQGDGADPDYLAAVNTALGPGERLLAHLRLRRDTYLPFAFLTSPLGPCKPGGARAQPVEDAANGDPQNASPPEHQDVPPVGLIEHYVHLGDHEPPPSPSGRRSKTREWLSRHLLEPVKGESRVMVEFPIEADTDAYHMRLTPIEGTHFSSGLHAWNLENNELFRQHNEGERFGYEKASSIHLYRTGEQMSLYESSVQRSDAPEEYQEHLWTYVMVKEHAGLPSLFQFSTLMSLLLGGLGVSWWLGWVGDRLAGAAASLLIPSVLTAVLAMVGKSLSRPFSQSVLTKRLLLIFLSLLLPLVAFGAWKLAWIAVRWVAG